MAYDRGVLTRVPSVTATGLILYSGKKYVPRLSSHGQEKGKGRENTLKETCGMYDVIQNGLTIRNFVVGIHRDCNHRSKNYKLLQLNLTEIKFLKCGIAQLPC